MGMLSKPKQFAMHYQEGQVFELQDAKVSPQIDTAFGPSTPVLLKIAGEWYSAFGQALVNQTERLERGELPARVALVRRPTKSGQEVKVLVPEAELTPEETLPF